MCFCLSQHCGLYRSYKKPPIAIVDSHYSSGRLGYIFPYCPVDEAIRVCIDPVENSVVATLGNTHGQESNTRRVKFQYYNFY